MPFPCPFYDKFLLGPFLCELVYLKTETGRCTSVLFGEMKEFKK